MKTLFAWDFHGVLEKDNELAVQAICNRVLKTFNFNKTISLPETLELYGQSWSDYFRYLSPKSSTEEIQKMHDLAVNYSREMVADYLKPMDFAHEVLSQIKEKGHVNVIISHSRPDRVKHFLEIIKINHLVDGFVGVPREKEAQVNIAQYKAGFLKKYAQEHGCQKIVMIGDSETDIEAGLMSQAITFLFQNKKINNTQSRADYKITDLREVLTQL